jgi:hypothetical protein
MKSPLNLPAKLWSGLKDGQFATPGALRQLEAERVESAKTEQTVAALERRYDHIKRQVRAS